ncbi:bifunctional 2-polyprenyl-6-hydroxyphenol methylase/3-demethylubiquinol 3-O-methyltransferase UbiG [Bradyrhizobium sp. sGM-13]|uniref:class I SAM-dependent methyltransferase n=1 Tax=Bradyrhizobium sp. sGM-13 TaxID=2831781 RepID=UPI001BCC6230|nr:class I SAM-dependent methyltransferase [Bradyrhizobium sp. sGM-13]
MDEQTLQFYRGNAEAYSRRTFTSRQARLTAFLALLPPGASILELGCGAGGDTAEMLARGFDVRPTDGSPEMAAIASKHLNRSVETLLFHDLDAIEAHDGVWANACLLHVPRNQLADVVRLVWRALKPTGYFFASYKEGDGDGRDTLNRYNNYPSPDWLRATYAEAGKWSSLTIESGEVIGFDDKMASMLFVVAKKAG